MTTAPASASPLAHRVKRIAHLDLPGSGEVVVQGRYKGAMLAPWILHHIVTASRRL